MMDNYHEILIRKNTEFVGTGHNSEIVSDDKNQIDVLPRLLDGSSPTGTGFDAR